MNNTIKPTKNGPLKVSGKVDILDESGSLLESVESSTYLCRCGNSSNKPFCDGTHAVVNFDSSKGLQEDK